MPIVILGLRKDLVECLGFLRLRVEPSSDDTAIELSLY